MCAKEHIHYLHNAAFPRKPLQFCKVAAEQPSTISLCNLTSCMFLNKYAKETGSIRRKDQSTRQQRVFLRLLLLER